MNSLQNNLFIIHIISSFSSLLLLGFPLGIEFIVFFESSGEHGSCLRVDGVDEFDHICNKLVA